MRPAPINESVSINIRAKTRQRDLIEQAAQRLGRSRSDFMLDAACSKAEDILLDQAFFTVEAVRLKNFKPYLIVLYQQRINYVDYLKQKRHGINKRVKFINTASPLCRS